jgi:negative regulator of flagellin synthesis FlgM
MKIDSITTNRIYTNSMKIQQKPVAETKDAANVDKLELSKEAVAFSAALKAAKQAMETSEPGRLQKLNQIKQQIENGTYTVSGEDIADKMLNR